MKITSLKNILKNRTPYEWLWLVVVVWFIVLLGIRMFTAHNGHRSWWNAIFHHKVVHSQLVSPVARTDDNDARVALINFYHKYNATTDKQQKDELVAKSGDPVFIQHYKDSTGADPVTCTSQKVTGVQIEDRILFNKDYVYSLIEYLQDNTQNYITASMISSNGAYKVGNVSCGQELR